MITNPPVSEAATFDARLGSIRTSTLGNVLKSIPKPNFRTDKSGDWTHESQELMFELVEEDLSMLDPELQAEFLDWVESSDYNKFRNKESGEFVYALVAKRGNVPYAVRKMKKRDALVDALDGKAFDHPIPGSHDKRMTRLLLITPTFAQYLLSMEEAWASLRSTPIEGSKTPFNLLNKLNANITKIFGKHGTLIAKEAQANGYPAPHIIVVLDRPVMVKRHVGKDGRISWRLCDSRILNRIGKGDMMRKLCRGSYRDAIAKNPIWKYGFIDFEGIVTEEGSKSGRDALMYPFKYLVKCLTEDGSSSIKDLKDISSVKDKSLRTMLFTHLGNKCFRTRDISSGKGFKDRVGMLPEKKSDEPSQWKRIKTITGYEYNFIKAFEEQKAVGRMTDVLRQQNGEITRQEVT
ncbi:MAG: hypothetical protein E7Z70_07695 [Thermoplasmata archaeon]|nr:hypothetical protein [Thermoplasmata archaeon]